MIKERQFVINIYDIYIYYIIIIINDILLLI